MGSNDMSALDCDNESQQAPFITTGKDHGFSRLVFNSQRHNPIYNTKYSTVQVDALKGYMLIRYS